MDTITMVTEPVFPVLYVLSDASVECVVMGWRGLANGLTFLHTKAGLSHNNLSLMCVYASTGNSQWKVGGLELAIKHSRIDHKVRSLAADILASIYYSSILTTKSFVPAGYTLYKFKS